MPPAEPRTFFSLLCLVLFIAVATAAAVEMVRSRRGTSLVTGNHFRLRMLSALVWLVVLGALPYACLFLWPAPGDLVAGRRFVSVVTGVILLLPIGLMLLAYDFWRISLSRRIQERRFQEELDRMARAEIDKARAASTAASSLNGRPDSGI